MSEYKTDIPNEDELLLDFLINKGIQAEIVIWDDKQVDWESYNIVIIKSTWDYFNKPIAFKAWLVEMKRREVNLFNPLDIVLWNMDKIYLKDLEKAGLPVIPSIWLDKGQAFDLKNVMADLKTDQIIVKPRISGASKNTFKVTTENRQEIQAKLNELLNFEDFMAQPFMEEVMDGEFSFIFFNGELSHTVKKAPHKDDFRVQHYFGGSITPVTPKEEIKEQAIQVTKLFAKDCLYARVDGIIKDGKLYFIELEVIEPMLYLHFYEEAFNNFLNAILSRIEQDILVN